MSLVRGASLTLLTRVGAAAIGVASSIILARALGPAGRGEYALIILIPAFIQAAGGFGLETSATYLVARNRDRASGLGLTLGLAALGLGALLIIAYLGVSQLPFYRAYLETATADPGLIWVLVVLLPLTLSSVTLTGAVLGLQLYRRYNLATLVPPVVNLALLLALVVALDRGVAGAVVASAVAGVVGLAAALTAFFTAAPGRARWRPDAVQEAFAYGARVHGANLAWFVHYRADMLLVVYLAGPAALGFYAVAVGLAEKLYLGPSAVGTVLFPKIASVEAEEANRLTPRACRQTLWMTAMLGGVLAALALPLIRLLYGADFLPAVTPLWILLPGVVSLAVGRLLSSDLNGRGMPGYVAWSNAAMALVNIALNLWWIRIWGAAGAAAATSVSYTAAVFLLGRRFTSISGASWRDLVRFGRSDRRDLGRALSALAGGTLPAGSTERS